jgi:hypothetical protein
MKNIFLTLPPCSLVTKEGSIRSTIMKMIITMVLCTLLALTSFGANAGPQEDLLNARLDCLYQQKDPLSKTAVRVCSKLFEISRAQRKEVSMETSKEWSYRNVGGDSFKKALLHAVHKATTKDKKEIVVGRMAHTAVYSLGLTPENTRVLFPVVHSHLRVLTKLSADDSLWENFPKKFNTHTRGEKFDSMVLGDGSKTKRDIRIAIRPYRSHLTGQITDVLPSSDLLMPDGTAVPFLWECWNLASQHHDPIIVSQIDMVKHKKMGETPETTETVVAKKSAFYGMKFQIEDGAWLFHGATAGSDWKGGGGEAVLWHRFGKGDQYGIGAGPIGGVSYGSSSNGYKWNEHFIGVQAGFRRDFWDSKHRPTGYGVKIRGMWDSVEGGNSQSGYHTSQRDFLLGGYAEVTQRRGSRWLIGAQLSGYAMLNAKQQSTWSGDKPQDRSSITGNIFAEYFLMYGANQTFGKWWWSIRGNLGASHQFWDNQAIAPISLQLRLGSKKWGVVGCGVQVGLPIGRSGQYVKAGVPWGNLVSLTEFCNYNYGGIVQRLDGEYRRGQVRERHDITFHSMK